MTNVKTIKHIDGEGYDKLQFLFQLRFESFLGLRLLGNLPILVYLLKSYRELLDSFQVSLFLFPFDIDNLSIGVLLPSLQSVSIFS